MSIGPCLPDLAASGAISRETAQEMGALFETLQRDYRRQFGDQAAADMASEDVVRAMERETLRRKRQALLAVRAQQTAMMNMRRYDSGSAGDGPINPRSAAALFANDGRAPYSNVEARRKAIRGQTHAMIAGILAEHRRTLRGTVRNPAELDLIGRELFGEATGDANARELADAWTRAGEYLRQRFNAAGGAIGKLDRWGLPQAHDARRVRAAGYQAWRDFITPRLDRARMIDERTGKPFSDAALELALRDVFETIRTDGLSKVTPGAAGSKALANRRAEHRFLHFRDYDGWASYADQYGTGNAFDAMLGHVEAMSRDIALMEVLGPNPAATVRWLKDTMQKQAAVLGDDGSKAIDAARAGTRQIDRLFAEISGTNNVPENRKLALGFSAVRSVQTAAKLGSATLSAVSDVGFQVATRKFNGLPARKVLSGYLKQLNPASAEDRMLAVRSGLIAEEWAAMSSAQSRYLNEELTGEHARRLAEGVLRASGLSAFTQAGRWAFGMEFLGHITHERGKAFNALDPAFRRAMERYGFTPADWDRLRATPLETHKGATWILPANIEDQGLADRLLEMILTETDYAVPTADLRTRAMINSFAPRGTIIGEIGRSALLFKSFGISVLLTHGRRAMELQGNWNRMGYAVGLTVALTLGGALAIQLKELARGRDPRPMTDREFWGAAMLQGGGFGIFGDFLTATENRFGGGLASTFAGPLVQSASNVGFLGNDLAGSVTGRTAKDRDRSAHAARRDFLTLLRQEVPGSSLWYVRAIYERGVVDTIETMIDADYTKHRRRLTKRAEEQGTDFWFAPGERVPARAPDLANAFAERQVER